MSGPNTGQPDCVLDADTYPGSIFEPEVAESYVPGDPLNVTWYMGRRDIFNTTTSRYDFTIWLQSFNLATNISLLNRVYDVEDVGTPRVQDFTQCSDVQLVERPTIPFELEVTEVLFNVVIVLNDAADSLPSGWTVGSSATGATFTISPTDFQVPPTGTTTTGPSTGTTATTTSGSTDPTTPANPTGNDNDSGLASSTKIGIGVGIAAAAIVLAIIGWMLWRLRRKMARYEKAAQTTTAGDTPNEDEDEHNNSSAAAYQQHQQQQQNYLPELDGPQLHEAGGLAVVPLNEKKDKDYYSNNNNRPISEIDGNPKAATTTCPQQQQQQQQHRPISELDGRTLTSPISSQFTSRTSRSQGGGGGGTISEMGEEEEEEEEVGNRHHLRQGSLHELA